MTLTSEDTARLAALKTVRDKLMMGQAVVRASYNGFDTTFSAGDIKRVESEIERLEAMKCGRGGKRRGAVGFCV